MRLLTVAVALSFVAATACSSGSASPTATDASVAGRDGAVATTTVDLPKSYRFAPQAIVVDTGATVTWTNHDDFPHTVALQDGSGTDKRIGIGESASVTFTTPGVVAYTCSLHPQQMKGTVTVREAS